MSAQLRVSSYYVRAVDEEDDCPQCGFPVLSGDTAYALDDPDCPTTEFSVVHAGFCCRGCALTYRRRLESEVAP